MNVGGAPPTRPERDKFRSMYFPTKYASVCCEIVKSLATMHARCKIALCVADLNSAPLESTMKTHHLSVPFHGPVWLCSFARNPRRKNTLHHEFPLGNLRSFNMKKQQCRKIA